MGWSNTDVNPEGISWTSVAQFSEVVQLTISNWEKSQANFL